MAKQRILKYPVSKHGPNFLPGHFIKDVVWSPVDRSIMAYISQYTDNKQDPDYFPTTVVTLVATGEEFDDLTIIGSYRKTVVCPEIAEVWHVFY